MHQKVPQHVFPPIMLQSCTILPAPTLTQDTKLNTHFPTRPSFAPITAFNRGMHKFWRSRVSLNQKRGRWGALHVCIAWKIYDDEQIKKKQQKLTPEFPTAAPPLCEQHQESHQFPCSHPKLNSAQGLSGKTTDHQSRFYRRRLPDLNTSPHHSHTTQREEHGWEKLEHPQHLNWKEKLMEKDKPNDPTNNSHKEKSQAPAATPEPDVRLFGSQDRKRQLECKHFTKVKRRKRELVHERLDPSQTDPSPHTTAPSALHPKSTQGTVTRSPEELVSYPGSEKHPYPIASWEPMQSFYSRLDHNTLTNYSVTTCNVVRTALSDQMQNKAFCTFYPPHLYYPPPLRQETANLTGREFPPYLHHCRYQLPHPGFLVPPSYPGL